MKRKITILAITAAILLTAAPTALAANGQPPVNGCQPGADNDIVKEWQLFSREEYANFLFFEWGAPTMEIALNAADRTYDFCDHNGDGYACVMQQHLPNDANGSSKWLLIEDNHPFGGQ